ncbi:PH domain-containing protein [Chryseobacterium sp. MEBOG06]|uniref:PH domain-containing protein n=1 Tax=Chryseobacterium sp. MEBOG06 TaxID=2879938 RepID=UPI001F2ECFFD|nr:PH domain-containing protein [Chryseobacterium sp. MEBOG06]UKB81893.1 PH domain-containing protein [Chryseobacterium sp. MEBOG06]
MNTDCALCGSPLTSMDTLLGENKLSDGGALCNKCLNKATNINKDLVSDLTNYSLIQIRDIVVKESIQGEEPTEEEIPVPGRVTEIPESVLFNSTIEAPSRIDEIKDQIAALNAKLSIFVNSEVNELVNVLDKSEKIIAIAEGKYLYNNLEGILVSTERRVVFVDKKFFGGVFENEFPLCKITSMQHSSGLLSSELKLFTEGFKGEFKLYSRSAAKVFYDAIQNNVYTSQQQQQQQVQSVQQTQKQQNSSVKKEDPALIFDKLEKLGKLRESGILTDEEFAEQKKKLLDKL